MLLGPIQFRPLLKHRAWGGTALAKMGRTPALGACDPLGESWQLADLPAGVPEGRSVIASGALAGLTLREANDGDRDAIMGRAALTAEGGFPLLVKILDAAKDLSIQVHPDASYAQGHPTARMKNEAWFVLHAEPGAVIHRGIDPALSKGHFAALLDSQRVLEALIRVPVRAGDCIQIPGGICHSLGAGIMAVEVQTPSDTTFRLWDWGRHDPKRPLHREEALDCMLIGAEQRLDELTIVNSDCCDGIEAGGFRTVTICKTPDFEIEEIACIQREGETTLEVITDGLPVVWVVHAGSISFEPAAQSVRDDHAANRNTPNEHTRMSQTELRAGPFETLLWPASAEGWIARPSPTARFLRVTLPDRMSRMLAG